MADWKQITARIRRARTSKDPAGQLAALYEKTNDAMVAFELAKYFETSAMNADAAKWYGTAAERFRRADWKTKAQEAAVRLGAEGGATAGSPGLSLEESSAMALDMAVPEPGMPSEPSMAALSVISSTEVLHAADGDAEAEEDASGASDAPASESGDTAGNAVAPSATATSETDDKRHRRRGRRGGRNRRKGAAAPEAAASRPTPSSRRSSTVIADESTTASELEFRPATKAMPPLPIETLPEQLGAGPKGRYGDPGLSSRISLLEMQFRRLLSCTAVKLDEANHAPVGPGVLVLTDSDLTSYYYVESCQTLKIAVANLLRGNASRRGSESITKQLAEHLGITEARVPKYLAEHCVVRWLQLDEGASHFAHFVIAVLRPILNE